VENAAALLTRLESLETAMARRSTPAVAQAMVRAARALTVMRQRYVEEALGEAIARGVRQYVMLGAGLDAFAYQPSARASVVRIFEVDHPKSLPPRAAAVGSSPFSHASNSDLCSLG
jgi:O-methyltransferase involved in polyketide biosynthesis